MRGTSGLLGLVLLVACSAAPQRVRVEVDGTIQYFTLEGGFWAILGDDGVAYDPVAFPPDFRKDSLRVHAVMNRLDDMASVHMVGPMVDVIEMAVLPCGPVPCPLPAPPVQLTVLDNRGLAVSEAALVNVSGPPGVGASSCESFTDAPSTVPTTRCVILGTEAGVYEADVISSGFQMVHLRVAVPSRAILTNECCPVTYVPERLVLTLSPAS